MANFKTFTRTEVKAQLKHDFRQNYYYSNGTIDKERKEDNEVIYGKRTYEEAEAYGKYAWQNIHHSNRKDHVAAVGYVITLPENITTQEEKDEFGKIVMEQITSKYKKQTILTAIIHRDENKEHLHVLLLPIVEDEKGGLKFCNRDYLTKKTLQGWHKELQEEIDKNKILGPAIKVYTGEAEKAKQAARERGNLEG